MMGARFFLTYTGRRVHPFDPNPGEISIFDIARSLSHMCRFYGHTDAFYSVAQHSVLVSQHVPNEDALWGLLHDAAEAYLGDMAAPIKREPEMAIYRIAENRLLRAVCERYGLRPEMPASVRRADKILLATEFRDVTPNGDPVFVFEECGERPLWDYHIAAWAPAFAEKMFLDRFEELTA